MLAERRLTIDVARTTPYRCAHGHTTLPYVSRHRQSGREYVFRYCRVCQKDYHRAQWLGLSVRRYRQLLALGQLTRPEPKCLTCDDTKVAAGRPCPDCWGRCAA